MCSRYAVFKVRSPIQIKSIGSGDGEIRTLDPLLARQVLSQLSYTPINYGSRLLSRAVSSKVPSAAQVLTVVFGMGTGVSPERIATINFLSMFINEHQQLDNKTIPTLFLRKEVIQPHLPIRLPCYDFTPVIRPAFGSSLLKGWVTDFGRC